MDPDALLASQAPPRIQHVYVDVLFRRCCKSILTFIRRQDIAMERKEGMVHCATGYGDVYNQTRTQTHTHTHTNTTLLVVDEACGNWNKLSTDQCYCIAGSGCAQRPCCGTMPQKEGETATGPGACFLDRDNVDATWCCYVHRRLSSLTCSAPPCATDLPPV